MSLPKSVVRNVLVVGLVAASAGCASVQRAPPERDAAVKAYKQTPGKASLYVFRDEMLGTGVHMEVVLDGKALGETQGHTFLYTPVDPGAHKLLSKAENDSDLGFTAEAGKNVFVWQEVKMGILKARSQLHLVDEERGRKGVADCQLVLPAGESAPAAAPATATAPEPQAPPAAMPAPAPKPDTGPVIRGGQWSPGEGGAYRPPGT